MKYIHETAIILIVVIYFLLSVSFVAAEQKEYQLESITVTAQKQEENVQDVPIGVTVFNGQEIEDRSIASLEELSDFVPNFKLSNEGGSGMNAPTMRGIYADSTTLRVSTGLFVDGLPIISSVGFEDMVLDIKRIEVLRGPQGTLYGKNTEAGAVNIITRQPDNEFRAKLSAEVGGLLSAETGDQFKNAFTLNMNGPLQTDKLFFGISGKFYQRDGYIKNTTTGDTTNDREHWFGRTHLRWTPTDRFDISFIGSMLKYDDEGVNMGLSEYGASMFIPVLHKIFQKSLNSTLFFATHP